MTSSVSTDRAGRAAAGVGLPSARGAGAPGGSGQAVPAGLADRTQLLVLLGRALDRSGDGPGLAVATLDLELVWDEDRDRDGWVGAAVLAVVAEAVVGAVRPFDVVAHLGGRRFAVLCAGPTRESDAWAVADRACAAAIASQVATAVPVRASAGVAVSRRGDTPDSILVRAEGARRGDGTAGRAARFLHADPGSPSADEDQLITVLVPLLFRASLSLHVAADVADPDVASQLLDVVDELDDVITTLRRSALARLRRSSDGASVRTAFAALRSAVTGAEEAVAREWGRVAPSGLEGEGAALKLVQASRLLRAAARALEPDILG